MSAPARCTISFAARRVNVTSMTASGGVPRSMAWASVATMVRVLPDPADARISVRPAGPLHRGELLLVEHRPQRLRRPAVAALRRPQPVDLPRRRVGGERVAAVDAVARRLLRLDVRQGGRRRLPARVAVGRGHGRER